MMTSLKNLLPQLETKLSTALAALRRIRCTRVGIKLSRENSRNHISKTCVPCDIAFFGSDSAQLKSFLAKEYESQTVFPPSTSHNQISWVVTTINRLPQWRTYILGHV